MIAYRSFRNNDPPELVKLWHSCRLGRGAAEGFTSDAFETINLSQPFFDADGLIVACDNSQIVGYVHAGFGVNHTETALDTEQGVICAIMVHPDYRRQGIGRELVARAETYMKSKGALSLSAGSTDKSSPFYVGMYGGCKPSGFLQSDTNCAPFFESTGYKPQQSIFILQRDLANQSDPVDFKLVAVRRKMQLAISQQTEKPAWWWVTRFGKLDTIRFLLIPKAEGPSVAGISVVGLDLYLMKWSERAIGLTELFVKETERRNRYGQMLVLDVCRRLKEELVTRAEVHLPKENSTALELFQKCGFEQIDCGIVYEKQ